ncbi:MAG: helicase-exonuclease AddAB subunit AddB [Eubacteriales bacterium]
MSLEIILGVSGSGKTQICYEQIIEKSLQDEKNNYILLVPEQFTLQTQKDIVSQHPCNGIMSIEVLSFQRLAYRIFEEVSGITKKILEESGKSMVIRKVIEDKKDDLKIFYQNLDKIGVINELKSSITELFQYNISEEQLDKVVNDVNNRQLQTKLEDLLIIYKGFKEFIEKNYIINEELLEILSDMIKESNFIRNSYIWIDGFTGFTPIQYKVISEIMLYSKEVKLTVTIDPKEKIYNYNRYQLFNESKKTIQEITKISKENSIETKLHKIDVDISKRFINQKTLAHLERYIFRYPYKPYKKEPEGIKVFIADNLNKEIDYIAREITHLIRDEGYRYKDIAIVTGELKRYEIYLNKVFNQYNIPFFIDQKKSILSNPLVEFIRTTFEIFTKYWSYESVLGYLRTGLSDLTNEEIDILENYVLAYGIKGKKKWDSTWDKPYPNSQTDDNEYIIKVSDLNEIRTKAIEPLLELHSLIKGKKHKVIDFTKSLYDFLVALRIEDKINDYVDKFKKENNLLLERQYRQVYKLVIEIFDKIVEILGDEEVSIKEYSSILESGLEQSQMGLVPPGLDQIVIGDIERTRLKDIKILFLIGANEGVIPKPVEKGQVLNDFDKEELDEKGVKLSPTSKEKSFEEQFNLYLSLTKPQDKLYISLSKLDAEFKTIRPSNLLSQIMKLFPKLNITYDSRLNIIEKVGFPKSTLKFLIEALRGFGDLDLIWKEVYSWYYKDEEWKPKIKMLIRGLFHQNKENYLSSETAKKLYGKYLKNSVSRLEQYASCPFAHFVKYGLRVNERVGYEISVPDIGIIFHQAIEVFSKYLVERRLDWATIGDELREQLVEEAVKEAISNYGNNIFYSSSKNAYLIKRVTRIMKRTIWALQKHIKSGEFKPTNYEVAFSSQKEDLKSLRIEFSDEQQIHLTGRVDRVDEFETEDKIYLKVLDYKSGHKSFDIVALYYGLQLQLLVYLNAVTEMEKSKNTKKVVPAGIFYYHIDDPMLSLENSISSEDREDELLKKLKMDGLVLEDIDVIRLIDKSFHKQSNIIPVKLKADGNFAANSSVASEERFKQLSCYVENKMHTIGKELIEGNVEIKPYEYKDKKACDYCPYQSICQFDPTLKDNNYNMLKKMNKKELWEAIESNIK